MKSSRHLPITLFLSLVLASCGAPSPLLKATGETATVQLQTGKEYTVEILAVQDSTLLCLADASAVGGSATPPYREVARIPASSIASIRVSGFRNNNWYIGVLVFQVLPAVGLGVAAASANADVATVTGAALMPALLTTMMFVGSGVPTPTFEPPFTKESFHELRTYARFAGDLSSSELAQLLQSHHQQDLGELKE